MADIPHNTVAPAVTQQCDRTALHTDLIAALYQYRSDLLRPPSPDSVERRLAWTDELIARASMPIAATEGGA